MNSTVLLFSSASNAYGDKNVRLEISFVREKTGGFYIVILVLI